MSEHQVMVFGLANEEYGISIDDIKEVDRLKEIIINRIPKVPAFVEGIVNLRGDVVPIINLRKKLDMAEGELTKNSRIIVVDIHAQLVGLLVDRISGVVGLREEEISSAPAEWDKNGGYISRVGKLGERVIFLLDAEKIIK